MHLSHVTEFEIATSAAARIAPSPIGRRGARQRGMRSYSLSIGPNPLTPTLSPAGRGSQAVLVARSVIHVKQTVSLGGQRFWCSSYAMRSSRLTSRLRDLEIAVGVAAPITPSPIGRRGARQRRMRGYGVSIGRNPLTPTLSPPGRGSQAVLVVRPELDFNRNFGCGSLAMSKNIATARRLRGVQTDAERTLWFRLRNRRLNGLKFRRQVPIDRYVVDFLCADARLVIELDGGQHATADETNRAAVLESMGYLILRFWNDDVLRNTDGVVTEILNVLNRNPSDRPEIGAAAAAAEQ
jgi:very-short-patch-repair endonuclease